MQVSKISNQQNFTGKLQITENLTNLVNKEKLNKLVKVAKVDSLKMMYTENSKFFPYNNTCTIIATKKVGGKNILADEFVVFSRGLSKKMASDEISKGVERSIGKLFSNIADVRLANSQKGFSIKNIFNAENISKTFNNLLKVFKK